MERQRLDLNAEGDVASAVALTLDIKGEALRYVGPVLTEQRSDQRPR